MTPPSCADRGIRPGGAGFTLVEILVATAVLVLLAGLVVQITTRVLEVWSRSSGKLSANAEARVAMDLLTRDLEAAFFRNDGLQWLRVEAIAEGTGGPYDGETVALKFFTPALDRDGPGELCAVAYRLAFKQAYENGPEVYALYRSLARPDDTFNDLMGRRADGSDPQLSLDEATAPAFWNAASIEAEENFLASNVVGFRIRVYEESGLGPVNEDADGNLIDYSFGGTGGSTVSPRALEIVLTVVSDQALKLLENVDRIPETATAIIREHGETYIRRVALIGRSL